MLRVLSRGVLPLCMLALWFGGCTGGEDDPISPTPLPDRAPEVRITAPADGASLTQGVTINLSGTLSDDRDAPAALLASWSSSRDGALSEGSPDSSGRFVYQTSTLSPGTHTLTLEARDSAGNVGTTSIEVDVRPVSNQPPTALITAPPTGTVLETEQSLSIEGQVSDAEDLPQQLTVNLRSSLQGELPAPDVSSAGLVTGVVTLSEGSHELVLVATDRDGASTTSAPVRVAVGSDLPPEVDFNPLESTRIPETNPVDLSAAVTDDVTSPEDLMLVWSSSVDGTLAACPDSPKSNGTAACSVTGLTAGDQEITLQAIDGAGNVSEDTIAFVINGAPSGLAVSISPDAPVTTDTLTVVRTQEPVDANDDPVHYQYQWYRNEVLVTAITGSSVPPDSTARGQTWRVVVTPSDDQLSGPSASASATIENSSPTLTTVDISPRQGVNSSTFFCLPLDYYDADGDAESFRFKWYADNEVISGATGSSLVPERVRSGAALSCEATPQDGITAGSPVRSPEVLLDSRAPSVASAAVVPATGTENTIFACQGSGWSDPDGDPEGYQYLWRINGVSGPTTATLSGTSFARGDSLECELTPDDGILTGAPVKSNTASVVNSVPSVSGAEITPSPAYVSSSLRCATTGYSDADGDAQQATYVWKVNGGVRADATGGTLSTGYVRGDRIDCAVSFSDGIITPVTVQAPALTISNAPPSISSVSISPTAGSAQTTFTAVPKGYADADGDSARYWYQWSVNGVETVQSPSLSPGQFSTGDIISVTVTPDDGIDTGNPRSSGSITVGSTTNPPSLGEVVLSPDPAYTLDTLTCEARDPVDPEGDDILLSYVWRKNGASVSGQTGETLVGTHFIRGDVIECEVTPRDATLTGSPVASSPLTIRNSLPVLASATLSPTQPTRASSMTCVTGLSSDADGDAVSFSFLWTVNGNAAPVTTGTLSNAYFKEGDVVVCSATPFDGTDAGMAVTSSAVTVRSSPPVIGSVLLTPSTAYETSTMTCTAQDVVDADGDLVSLEYVWRKNGSIVGGQTTMTLVGSSFNKSDSVQCEVTPVTSRERGTTVASNSVVIQNSIPSIGTVSLTPTTAFETSTLTCSAPDRSDADGDVLQMAYSWTVNGVKITATTSTLKGSSFDRGDQVRCSVTVTDSSSASSSGTSGQLTISNSVPVLASAVLGPEPAFVTDVLSCTPGQVTDADDDPTNLIYQWRVNGAVVSGVTTSFMSASSLDKGDQVVCVVTPVDDLDAGTAVTSNTVTIANKPPTLTSVQVLPEPAYETTTLSCSGQGSGDADGDRVTLKYAWTVNGINTGRTTQTLTGAYFNKGDQVICTVTPNDGFEDGIPVSSAPVRIENSAPSIEAATLSPTVAYETSQLTCAGLGLSDADPSDASGLSIRYAWLVDGVSLEGVTTSTLTGTHFNKGQTLACIVTPYDGTALGQPVTSNSVTILNSVPSLSSVSLTPTTAYKSTTFTCTPQGYSDADGDAPQYSYAWYKNSVKIPDQTAASLAGVFVKGDAIRCDVVASDGTASIAAVASNTVTVLNTAPTLTSASLAPTTATVDTTLTCTPSGYSDLDGDAPEYTYTWYKNSAKMAGQSASTLLGVFIKGDVIRCEIVASDGTASTATVASNSVTIANSVPSLTAVNLTPATAYRDSTFQCTPADYADADGDAPRYTYSWYKNSSKLTGQTNATLAGVFVKDDSIRCEVVASDGTASTTAVSSSTVTVRNSSPTLTTVLLTPTSAYRDSMFQCTPSDYADLDGDSPLYTYTWYKNSIKITGQSSATLSGVFTKNDAIRCEVVASDGTISITTVASNTVTVLNTAPTLTGASLAPTTPTVDTTLVCTPSGFSDIDGDAPEYTYTWYKNSAKMAGQSASTLLSVFIKGDVIRCEVVASDGTVSTAAVPSDSVTIENSAPSLETVTLTPTSAYRNSTFQCTPSDYADADGDLPQYTYTWTKNSGVVAGQTGSTLQGVFVKGDKIRCEVVASDGSASTAAVSSSTVTVQNSSPTLTTVLLTPSPAYRDSNLQCAPTDYADLDGDDPEYTYAWYKNSIVISGQVSSTLSGVFVKGDIVRCEVVASDGEASISAVASNTLTVLNSLPTLTGATLTPDPAYAGSTLSCTPDGFSDGDGDAPQHTYAWYKNDVLLTGQSSDDLSGVFVGGDKLQCRITPGDGEDSGTEVISNAVVITNSAPAITGVSLSPASPTVLSVLTCTPEGYSDADGDDPQYAYAWTVNGEVLPNEHAATLSVDVVRDDEVSCEITPGDGQDQGMPVGSDTVTVGNAPPQDTTVAISPTDPEEGDALSAAPDALDPDGDLISYSYEWTIDGEYDPTFQEESIPAGLTLSGQIWTVVVTPDDGLDFGPSATDSVTIGGGSVEDADADGYTTAEGDCNDSDATSFPYAAEPLDLKDNDCNGVVDDRWELLYSYGNPPDSSNVVHPVTGLELESDGLTHALFPGKDADTGVGSEFYVTQDALTAGFSAAAVASPGGVELSGLSLYRPAGSEALPRLAYYETPSEQVRFYWSNGSWQSAIDVTATGADVGGLGLVTASDGTDYLIYSLLSSVKGGCALGELESRMFLAKRTATGTSFTLLNGGSNISTACSTTGVAMVESRLISADASTNYLHSAWYQPVQTRLRYKKLTSTGTGTTRTVVTNTNLGPYLDLTTDPTDATLPFIVAVDVVNGQLMKYTTTDSISFTQAVLLTGTQLGGSAPSAGQVHARTDADGTLHLLLVASGSLELWYVRIDGTEVIAEQVFASTASLALVRTDLEVDADRNPRISFVESDTQDFYLWKGKRFVSTLPY